MDVEVDQARRHQQVAAVADLGVGGIGTGAGVGANAPLTFPSLAMRTLFPELEVLLRDFVGTRDRPVKLITAVDLDYAA